MLVISQDKKLQTEYRTGLWQVDSCKVYWLSLTNDNYWLEFGTYSSNENAIMALNQMKEAYLKYVEVGENGYRVAVYNFPKVFQIPTENEINEPTVQDIVDDLMKM
jgi:hypothetical protein